MTWTRRTALLAGATTLVVAPALAALHVAANHGFGSGDIAAFAIWGILPAALVAALSPALSRANARRSRPAAVAVALLAGFLLGALYTLLLALVLGPVVHAFSFPILYIWGIAAAIGMALAVTRRPPETEAPGKGMSEWVRRALVGVALTLAALIFLLFAFFFGWIFIWNRGEPAVHLIPAGYEGPVVIVFGDSAGEPARREGKARVYHVPPDGVLRTRAAQDRGWNRSSYYYSDGATRTRLARVAYCADSLAGDPVAVCDMPVMFMSGREAPAYESYLVGRRHSRITLQARWDSTVHWSVFGDSARRPGVVDTLP